MSWRPKKSIRELASILVRDEELLHTKIQELAIRGLRSFRDASIIPHLKHTTIRLPTGHTVSFPDIWKSSLVSKSLIISSFTLNLLSKEEGIIAAPVLTKTIAHIINTIEHGWYSEKSYRWRRLESTIDRVHNLLERDGLIKRTIDRVYLLSDRPSDFVNTIFSKISDVHPYKYAVSRRLITMTSIEVQSWIAEDVLVKKLDYVKREFGFWANKNSIKRDINQIKGEYGLVYELITDTYGNQTFLISADGKLGYSFAKSAERLGLREIGDLLRDITVIVPVPTISRVYKIIDVLPISDTDRVRLASQFFMIISNAIREKEYVYAGHTNILIPLWRHEILSIIDRDRVFSQLSLELTEAILESLPIPLGKDEVNNLKSCMRIIGRLFRELSEVSEARYTQLIDMFEKGYERSVVVNVLDILSKYGVVEIDRSKNLVRVVVRDAVIGCGKLLGVLPITYQ